MVSGLVAVVTSLSRPQSFTDENDGDALSVQDCTVAARIVTTAGLNQPTTHLTPTCQRLSWL